ncbi:unnamed protein product [marine sediment metagenome]|uniref:Uncharacterized protein n=1 Tax=marine sediment metagenome TaxID=412755 RepID=X1E0Y3_9ZZZZ
MSTPKVKADTTFVPPNPPVCPHCGEELKCDCKKKVTILRINPVSDEPTFAVVEGNAAREAQSTSEVSR